MPPPYNRETNQLLQDLVQQKCVAPESWPFYPIILRGQAKTYEEGLKRIDLLNKQVYVFSTDNEEHGQQKSDSLTKIFKAKSRVARERELKRIMPNKDNILQLSDGESSSSVDDFYCNKTSIRSCGSNLKVKGHKKNPNILGEKISLNFPKSGTIKKRIDPKKPSEESPSSAENRTPKNNLNETSNLKCETISRKNTQSISNNTQLVRKELCEKQNLTYSSRTLQGNIQAKNSPQDNAGQVVEDFAADFSKDTLLLHTAIKSLASDVKEQTLQIRELRASIQQVLKIKTNTLTVENFAKKFGLTLKLETLNQLEEFDKALAENEEFRADFKKTLHHLLDSEMKKTILAILKRYMHRKLAVLCTAVRKTKDKYLLKNTCLYEILFEFISKNHTDENNKKIKEVNFNKALAGVLNNAKDWDGQRNVRRLIQQSQENVQVDNTELDKENDVTEGSDVN